MKFKKITAMMATVALFATFAVSASADYADATVTATISKTTVAAGDEITIDYSYDTLENSNGGTIFIAYDGNAFATKEGISSIKIGKKTYDFENYISQTALNAFEEETHILYGCFGTFVWTDDTAFVPQYTAANSYQKDMVDAVGSSDVNCVKFVYGDSSYSVDVADEAEDMYPVNTVGATFVAKNDIADGTYTFAVYSYANDKAATLVNYDVKTFTVTVGNGGNTGDDDTATAMADGVPVTKGVYAGKTSASTDVVATKDLVKVVISNDVDTSKTLTWDAPKTYGEGKTNVLAVLLYDANAMKNSTFTVKFLGAADAVIKTFTHKVQ